MSGNKITFLIFLCVFVAINSQVLEDTWVYNVCFCITAGKCTNNMTSSTTIATSTTSSVNTVNNGVTTAAATTDIGSQTTTTAVGSSTRRPDLEQPDGSVDTRMDNDENNTSNSGNILNPNIFPFSVGAKLVVKNQTSCGKSLDLCCPTNGYGCGMRYTPIENASKPNENGQSIYGQYPWEIVILSENNAFISGGVLIHNRYALTAAHKIYNAYNIKVVLGKWNMSSTTEYFDTITYLIPDESVKFHPDFKSFKTLKNDIAIIMLPSTALPLGVYPTITPVCLPNQPLSNQRCWVPGWGKNSATNESNQFNIMSEADVPLVNTSTCETLLKATRLGEKFTLDEKSFICAGGEAEKDASTGGSGLVCSVNGRFYLAGLVAWGIGRGKVNTPGVYVNVTNFVPWIQATIRSIESANIQATTTTTTKASTTTTKITTKTTTKATTKTTTTATTTTTTNNSSSIGDSTTTSTQKVSPSPSITTTTTIDSKPEATSIKSETISQTSTANEVTTSKPAQNGTTKKTAAPTVKKPTFG